MWDDRYRSDEYVFGTAPNDFLAAVATRLPAGRVLSLGEGEGRNAVYLAELGFQVLAVDSSAVGLAKAQRLAKSRGVTIETQVADLADYDIQPGSWDVIISFFCHAPSVVRKPLHRKVVRGLCADGVFVLEAYTPAQLELKTGGPPTKDQMMSLISLQEELAGLDFIHGIEIVRNVVEGRQHTGQGAVVQVLARKP